VRSASVTSFSLVMQNEEKEAKEEKEACFFSYLLSVLPLF
jgi:hypothetical protein